MNERFTLPPQRPTTQAAEGLPRWCWTVAEIEHLADAGTCDIAQRTHPRLT